MAAHRRLIIRPGAIGDFILSLPALHCLQTEYLEVWAAAQNLPLARFADQTRSIASTGLDMLEFDPRPGLLTSLRSFDSIISWYGTNRPEFRKLVESLDLPFHFFTALPPPGLGLHAADFFLQQAQTIATCRDDGIPRIEVPRRGGEFAVIHPFAASAEKRWPLEKFQQLAGRLERQMPVRWCAGPEDSLPGAVRIENLYELGCWLAMARLYIGNDSGITHLAAAVGTPVIALFGPTDPRVWAPRGANVRVIPMR